MAITTVEYKAAIEAKIASYTSGTPLTELAITKSNADLWLANNSGGSITGYAALEALIQTKQNALTGSSTLTDISLTGTSAYLPSSGSSGGMAAIPASSIKSKSGAGNKPLLTYITNAAQNATGAGITYTVTGKCLLVACALLNLTTTDTIYTLTDRSSGKIMAETTTPTIAGTSIAIVNSSFAVSASNLVSTAQLPVPIEFETGFTLFVKTTTDTDITVDFSYLELS